MPNRKPRAGHKRRTPRRIEEIESVVPSRRAFEIREIQLDSSHEAGTPTCKIRIDLDAPRQEIERSFGRALTRLLDQRQQWQFGSLVVKVITLRRWSRDPGGREAQARPLARRLSRLERVSSDDSLEKRLLRHRLHWLTKKTRPPSAGELQRALKGVYGLDVPVRQVKRVLYEAHRYSDGRHFGYADWS